MNEDKCTCEDSDYEDYCPYAEEMASDKERNDEDFLESIKCSCCDFCRYNCAMDI